MNCAKFLRIPFFYRTALAAASDSTPVLATELCKILSEFSCSRKETIVTRQMADSRQYRILQDLSPFPYDRGCIVCLRTWIPPKAIPVRKT